MIIKDLIAKLQSLDGDAMLVTASYEAGGFKDLTEIEQIDLVPNRYKILDGSTHHRAEWTDGQRGKSVAAFCLGPLDPSCLGDLAEAVPVAKKRRTLQAVPNDS